VKFPVQNGQLEPITSQDTSIASLVTLITSLRQQTASITDRITALTQQAQSSLALKNRTAALSALRSKKLAESTLKQRSDTLAQLEEVLAGIEQAADQVEIVNVLEGSRDVLRGLNKEVGGVDRVEDVLEDLREEMGKVDEVGEALREGATAGVDEDEVDEELAAMEAEEKRVREEKEAEERRTKEEKEAEEMRRRLAGIESNVPEEKKEEVAPVAQTSGSANVEAAKILSTAKADADLEDSIKRLSQMSVEDAGPAKEGSFAQEEQRDRKAEQPLPAD
jgi:charged multivesicular body protein 7